MDTVVVSGVVPLSVFHLLKQSRALGPKFAAKLAWNVALFQGSASFGQALLALRLADGARGAPLIVDGRVYLFGQTGSIRVLRLADGKTLCAVQSPFAFDQAGPVAAGSPLIAGALAGDVVAIPRRLLDECRAEALERLFSLRSTPPRPEIPMR